jgi:hypothetical protein
VEKLEELTAQWKEQYGEVYEIKPDNPEEALKEGLPDAFYFRLPGRPELSRFAKTAMTDSLKALNNLCMDCVIYPDRSVVSSLFDHKPGLAISLGAKVQQLVGTSLDFTHRKL